MTDRELVVSLAERVMEWKRGLPRPYSAKWGVERWIAPDGERFSLSWNPLESIADAFMLVEALHKKSHWFRIQSSWDKSRKYYAGFEEDGFTGWNGRPTYQGMADSAPRAIRLAAARVVGIKDKEN